MSGDHEKWDIAAPSQHAAPPHLQQKFRQSDRRKDRWKSIAFWAVLIGGIGFAIWFGVTGGRNGN